MNKKKGYYGMLRRVILRLSHWQIQNQIAAVDIISTGSFSDNDFQLFLFAERKETEKCFVNGWEKLVKGYSSRNRRVASVVWDPFAFLFGCGAWFSYRGFGETDCFQMIYLLMTGARLFSCSTGVPPSFAVSGKAFPAYFFDSGINRFLEHHFLCR